MYQCNYCLQNYNRKSTLFNHKKTCVYKKSPKITLKTNNLNNHIINVLSAMSTEMEKNNQHISKMAQEIKELKDKPSYQINNILITEKLPDCFYQALIKKLGKTKAVNLLNLASASNSAIDVYKELYPSNKMQDNPVIYDENTFKYLKNNKIISDNEIIVEIANRIQTAMLYASSDIITESIKVKKTNQLYDVYDIGKIQENVRNRYTIEKQVSNYIKLELING